MEIEELQEKAKNGEIMLQDLEVEDILKFKQLGFLNPSLVKYFNLDTKDINKIRAKKGLQNAEVQDAVRNGIVLGKYLENNHPELSRNIIDYFVEACMKGIGSIRKKEKYYNREIDKLDIHNMNFQQEIKERKIEEKWRLKYLKDYIDHFERTILLSSDVKELDSQKNTFNSELFEFEYSYKPTNRKRIRQEIHNVYPRNEQISKNALEKAHYKCELNFQHQTFIRKSDGNPYMEPHHLIPLKFQNRFDYSLDNEANIVCLCSNCHNEIHYGENQDELIKILYYRRKEYLRQCGIKLNDIGELYQMYHLIEDQEMINI